MKSTFKAFVPPTVRTINQRMAYGSSLADKSRSPLRKVIINLTFARGPLTMEEIENLVIAQTGLPYTHKEVAMAVNNLCGDHKLVYN